MYKEKHIRAIVTGRNRNWCATNTPVRLTIKPTPLVSWVGPNATDTDTFIPPGRAILPCITLADEHSCTIIHMKEVVVCKQYAYKPLSPMGVNGHVACSTVIFGYRNKWGIHNDGSHLCYDSNNHFCSTLNHTRLNSHTIIPTSHHISKSTMQNNHEYGH